MADPSSKLVGPIRKMSSEVSNPVCYALPVGDELFPINERLGKTLRLEFRGKIHCIHCNRSIKKTYQQGFCFPCFRKLARCDQCLVKPELCHYHVGTCREPLWGEQECMIAHTVYLANTSGLKVGITRSYQQNTRWIDQGASQALAICTAKNRLESGKIEVALRDFVADKTNWRKMLTADPAPLDLPAERDRLLEQLAQTNRQTMVGVPTVAQVAQIRYPVLEYPAKVVSHNLEKDPVLEGMLTGIKGQYLMFEGRVINMRKYAGYVLQIS